MIKIILLVLISFSSFAIVPGVLENKLSDKVVKVKFTRLGFSKSGICTASVIASDKILTAGHCVKGFLEDRQSFLRLKVNHKSYAIINIVVPPKYLDLQRKYDDAIENDKPFASELKNVSKLDVAIIKVRGNLLKKFKLTKIATSASSDQVVKLCGYGYINFVEELYEGNESQELYCAKNTLKLESNSTFIKGNLLYSRYYKGLTAPGDSGSPLFDNDMNQIGVLSGITKNDAADATSYYANLLSLKKFLDM